MEVSFKTTVSPVVQYIVMNTVVQWPMVECNTQPKGWRLGSAPPQLPAALSPERECERLSLIKIDRTDDLLCFHHSSLNPTSFHWMTGFLLRWCLLSSSVLAEVCHSHISVCFSSSSKRRGKGKEMTKWNVFIPHMLAAWLCCTFYLPSWNWWGKYIADRQNRWACHWIYKCKKLSERWERIEKKENVREPFVLSQKKTLPSLLRNQIIDWMKLYSCEVISTAASFFHTAAFCCIVVCDKKNDRHLSFQGIITCYYVVISV